MNQKLPSEQLPNTKLPHRGRLSAQRMKNPPLRITQGDLFEDLELIERIDTEKSILTVEKISFPYTVCLNQECDLVNDYDNIKNKDVGLIHVAFAPAFNFDQYLQGTHWGGIFQANDPQKRTDTIIKKIMNNEIPRYHYLLFDGSDLPELIIDFKHFFSINRHDIYKQISKRKCSLNDLYREAINQRFSSYISRIGLPD
jgi:hypothetical protein